MRGHIGLGPGNEFDLVRRMLHEWGDLAEGVGSDCASLNIPAGMRAVMSTDSTVEGVHFRREWMTAREVGYRAAASALSDLAAAGATPLALLVAFGIPASWVNDVIDLCGGIGDAVRMAEGARIVGGDTARSPALMITMAVFGCGARPLTRSGARPGDRLVVTGDVGRSARALQHLMKGEQPSAVLWERFVRPVPRIREGSWLAANGATAAIDVSDGLGSELAHLAAASGVRLRVDLHNIPVTAGITPLDAMRSGEEYELLVTLPPSFPFDQFRSAFTTALTVIGEVTDGEPGVDLISKGELIALPRGYDHF